MKLGPVFLRKIEGVQKDQKLDLIVPRKALGEVLKMTDGLSDDETVLFGRSENHVFFIVGEHKLTSTVVEGTFPRYENVLPKNCQTDVVVPTEEMTQAVIEAKLETYLPEGVSAEEWDLDFWQRQTPEERLSALVTMRRDVDTVEQGKADSTPPLKEDL